MSSRTPNAVGAAGAGAALTMAFAMRAGMYRAGQINQRLIDEAAAARQRSERARYRAELVVDVLNARDRANAALDRWLVRQADAARYD